IEFICVVLDDEKKTARLNLRVPEVLDILYGPEASGVPSSELDSLWRPEYGSYMIEGTPGSPYGHSLKELTTIEANMRIRRIRINEQLKPGECVVAMTNFPRLGCPDCTEPPSPPQGPIAKSLFIPDSAINPHPRFGTLTKSIRERKGRRVDIDVPIFHDKNTPNPFVEEFPHDDGEAAKMAKPDTIYMDAMCFGMGCCCVQVTFQACSVEEGRYLYDMLTPVSPIMLAMTAGAPVFRGLLADVDCRWNVISASVDDRTDEELGKKPLKENKFVINKSRYDSIDSYLSPFPYFKAKYNDLPIVLNQEVYDDLKQKGIDHLLAQHIAHLYIRDPLVVFQETMDQDDANQSDHFENIQSTNWQTMRFKPPPPNSDIGWRVEFRSMELQMTDFENSAFTVFIVLLTRAILSFNLNLYMPITKVDENVQTAQKNDASRSEKFYFRKHLDGSTLTPDCDPDAYELMDINTIINGNMHRKRKTSGVLHVDEEPTVEDECAKQNEFPGLLAYVRAYLNTMVVDVETSMKLQSYLNFISKKASGDLMTTAQWMRGYIKKHPDYKQDSVISDSINYDICKIFLDAGEGRTIVPELTGDFGKKNPIEVTPGPKV
ncbi:glutamate-cysteine ligase catalytic subunit, partial [Sphaeroforma arctica JP610]